jgi:hypothetical protein
MTKSLVLLFLFSWLFTACSKKADKLGSEYQSLVGKWEIVNQNAEQVRITFKDNGKVVFEKGAERAAKYKVSEMVEVLIPANPTPETWHNFDLKTNGEGLRVYKKKGYADTIKLSVGTLLVDTVGVNAVFSFYRIKN